MSDFFTGFKKGMVNFGLNFSGILNFVILGLVYLLGVGNPLIYSFTNKYYGNFPIILKHTLLFSLFGSFILFATGLYQLSLDRTETAFSLLTLGFILPIYANSNYFQPIFTSEKKFRSLALINILSIFLSNISLILVILFFQKVFLLVLASIFPPLILNSYFTLKQLFKYKFNRVDSTYIKTGWHLSITFSINFLAKSLDKLLLGILLPLDQLAIYSFALIIPDQAYGVTKYLTMIITPKIASLSEKNIKNNLFQKFILASLIVIFGIFLYFLLAPLVFSIFFPKYQASIMLSQIYSLSLISIPSFLFTYVFQKLKRNKYFYIQDLSLIFTLIILFIIMVPKMGILGAVIAQLIARGAYLLVTLILYSRIIKKIN